MKTYHVVVGGSTRIGRFGNTYVERVIAKDSESAKRLVIKRLRKQHVNLPGKTTEETIRWSSAKIVR